MNLFLCRVVGMKKFFVVACVCLFGFFLSGCGEDDLGPVVVPSVELQIWTTEKEVEFFSALGREFDANISDLDVSFKVVPFTSDAVMESFLVEQMAEGRGPDVIYSNGNWVANNKNKLIFMVDDPTLPPEKFRESFVLAASDALLDSDNRLWGVPMGISTLGLIFNAEHLLNIRAGRMDPGGMWSEFREDVSQLNKPDNSFGRFAISGAALGRLDNVVRGFEILENLLVQSGVAFFSPDGSVSTLLLPPGDDDVKSGKQGAVDALSFFVSFADEKFKNFSWSSFLASKGSVDKDFEAFAAGKVSMVFGFAEDFLRVRELVRQRKEDDLSAISEQSVRVAFLPQVEDPKKSHSRVVVGKVHSLAVPFVSRYPEIAWRFLKFAVAQDNLRAFHAIVGVPTPLLSLIPEQEVTPGVGIFVRQAKFARANLFPLSRALLRELFARAVLDVNIGKKSPEGVLRLLDEGFSGIVQEEIRRRRIVEGG